MPAALISLSGVYVTRQKQGLLSNINLEVKPGQIVTVVGPNGGGKSTLIRVALNLHIPQAGKVYHRSGLKIGYLPQKLYLGTQLPITVKRFLALHPHYNLEKQSIVCEHAQLKKKLLQAQMDQLSNGERQRVLLARALLQSPDLLALDEPDAGLDLAGQLNLYQVLESLRAVSRTAILLVSHEIHWVMAKTDHVICLEKTIACEGAPQQIQTDACFLSHFPFAAQGLLAPYQHHHKSS